MLPILFAVFAHPNLIYEVPTHQLISRLAAARSVALARELSEFEWSDLEHSGAAYTSLQQALQKFADRSIVLEGSAPIDLIGKGGVSEDAFETFSPSTWRFLNHFLDHESKGGLAVAVTGQPSDQWGCCAVGNQFRWAEANYWYLRALSDESAVDREAARVHLFRSLGQVVHLIQDAYQPSHTRNDSHSHLAGGVIDGYSALELWGAGAVTPTKVDVQVGLGLAGAFAPATGDTLQTFFYDAAEFSGQRFFSDDTIFQNLERAEYPKPNDDDTLTGSEQVPILGGTTSLEVEFLYSDTLVTPLGQPVRLARKQISVLDLFDVTEGDQYTLKVADDRIVRDHASVLLPQALRSSIGVLDHFFRGDLELALETVEGESRLQVTNRSRAAGTSESLALGQGVLRLFYETVEGTLLPVPGYGAVGLSGLAPEATTELQGDLLQAMLELASAQTPAAFRAVEDRTVTVVFEGVIGQENGVCASRIDVRGFRIVQFTGDDSVLDDGSAATLVFEWEGDPVFPVTFRWDKQTCNADFWSDCDDDEAFTWSQTGNPLSTELFTTGCASTTEFISGEVWLTDSLGNETQRVPWDVTAIFIGSQCLPAPGQASGSGFGHGELILTGPAQSSGD